MSRSDDLKNRLDELFSAVPVVEAEVQPLVKPESQASLLKPILEDKLAGPAMASAEEVSAQAFQGAFENVAIGMILTGLDGRLIRVNEAFSQMLGYPQAELEGMSFQTLTHPEDLKVGAEAMRAMLSGVARTARIEKRYLHKDGPIVWVELNITLMRDAEEKPAYFVTIALDVSRQHETAAMLEKRVQELNCLNDIGHMVDRRPELGQFFEWVTERIPAAFQHPETCIAAVEYQGRVYGNEAAVNSPSKIVNGLRIGGELVGWLHVAYTEARHFIDAESALMGAIVSRMSGYLENVQQDAELGQRADLLTAIMDATPDWIFVKDHDHRFITVNQSFAAALGRSKDDFPGKNDLEMGFPEEAVMGDPALGIQGYWWDDERVLSTGESQTILGEKNFLDGELHYFDVFKTAMRDAQNKIIGLMGYARDVTERANLLSEIQSKAEHEQRLREIAGRVRASSDVDTILRTAVRELGDALGRKTFIRLAQPEETEMAHISNNNGHRTGGNGSQGQLAGGEQ